jgi:hypothetical protein
MTSNALNSSNAYLPKAKVCKPPPPPPPPPPPLCDCDLWPDDVVMGVSEDHDFSTSIDCPAYDPGFEFDMEYLATAGTFSGQDQVPNGGEGGASYDSPEDPGIYTLTANFKAAGSTVCSASVNVTVEDDNNGNDE